VKSQRSFFAQFIALIIIFAQFSCGGGDGNAGDPGIGENNDDQNDEVSCNTTLQTHIENLNDFSNPQIASWDDISCFTTDLVRLDSPEFYKMAHSGDTVPGTPDTQPAPTVLEWIDHWDDIYTSYGSNISPALMSPVPPWVDESGEEFEYPLSAELLDQKLRSASLIYINEKLKGRRIRFVQFYPPSADAQTGNFDDLESFHEFFTNRYVTEKVTEATIAELVKAEYYNPFPLEIEIFVKNLNFSGSLTTSQQIQLAQDIIDELYVAVSPIYNGDIEVPSVGRYTSVDDEWSVLDFSNYDLLAFGLFPECNLAITQDYLDIQIANFEAIVERDQVPWIFSEIFINPELFTIEGCDQDFSAIEVNILNAVVTTMESTANDPIGAGFDQYLFVTEEARQFVVDYFASK
jgi:hypothetical protein